MNNTSKLLIAVAAGAVAGLAAGILLAPDKGAETRRKIKEQGKKLTDNINNRINELTKQCSEACKEEAV